MNPAALDAFDIRPMGIARAIERALPNEDRELAETRWSRRADAQPDLQRAARARARSSDQ